MSDLPSPGSPPLYPMNRPARVSAASVTSLVLGVLLCVPLVTSLGAIIFALVGMRATRDGMRRGKGLAIAGLILGIVGVVAWVGTGSVVAMVINGSAAPRAVLHDFSAKMMANDITGALAESDPVITRDALEKVRATLVPSGAYRDLTCFSAVLTARPQGKTCILSGNMHFSGGEHTFTATLIKDASGAWKMYGFHVL